MKLVSLFLVSFLSLSATAFAKQSLQAAMVQNPQLAALVEAIKASSHVDCLTVETFQTESVYGPEGKKTITQQSACFDPSVFNPTQLGQLVVTYYGTGDQANSPVGDVVSIQYEVFK